MYSIKDKVEIQLMVNLRRPTRVVVPLVSSRWYMYDVDIFNTGCIEEIALRTIPNQGPYPTQTTFKDLVVRSLATRQLWSVFLPPPAHCPPAGALAQY